VVLAVVVNTVMIEQAPVIADIQLKNFDAKTRAQIVACFVYVDLWDNAEVDTLTLIEKHAETTR
jgi:hypothetical protein